MFDVTLLGAFAAGLLSFLSPCVLPIVPFYLSYLAGVGVGTLQADAPIPPGTQRRAVLASILFALGVVTIFVALGATATAFGQIVREWFDVLRWVAAALIITMGLHFLGVIRITPPRVVGRDGEAGNLTAARNKITVRKSAF